ncbi:hypothetical protein [Streptomyces sp. 1222.5]|uniref:hypothetical protein n=1 Tax=Streptomyces sp. 1222.5 TaxID=1881026 RepID=UPI003EC06E63
MSAAMTLTVIVVGLQTLPAPGANVQPLNPTRTWEIPVRMMLSGVTVVAAVAAADALGSFLGGVLSSLPVLLSIMGSSVHRAAGAPAATDLMRGALSSAAGTLGFLLVLCYAPQLLGPLAAFLLALTALLVSDSLLRWSVLRAATAQPA